MVAATVITAAWTPRQAALPLGVGLVVVVVEEVVEIFVVGVYIQVLSFPGLGILLAGCA